MTPGVVRSSKHVWGRRARVGAMAVGVFVLGGVATRVAVGATGASSPVPGAGDVVFTAKREGAKLSQWNVRLSTPRGGCARAEVAVDTAAPVSLQAPCKPGGDPGQIDVEGLELRGDTYIVARVRSGETPTSSLELFAYLCGSVVRASLGADVARPGSSTYFGFGSLAPYDRIAALASDRHTVEVRGPAGTERWRADGCSLARVAGEGR